MRINTIAAAGLWATPGVLAAELPLQLKPESFIKGLKPETTKAPMENSVGYTAQAVGDGLLYRFPKGLLAQARYLTLDLLVDGNHLAVFILSLREGESGPAFDLQYKGLNQCAARVRLPLEAADLNRWMLAREGAWLKPICGGERVDWREVDRITLTILHKSDRPVRWFQTPITLTTEEPPRLSQPLLPKGKLIDELGQSTIHEWPEKSRNAEEVTQRLREQLTAAPAGKWPDGFSAWGGWKEKKIKGTGFFARHHDGKRWWLVDPDGCLFWSTGLDCVRPGIEAAWEGLQDALAWIPPQDGEYKEAWSRRSVNYLAANFIRAFGSEKWMQNWETIVLSQMRAFGFNTVANWSSWQVAQKAKVPYVRPLSIGFSQTPKIYRDFPDVFHPAFAQDAQKYAQQLGETKDDPALIGYFLMNEPTWGFSRESPAAGMLFNTPACATRKALSEFLRGRHGNDAALSKAWGIQTRLAEIAEGEWKIRLTTEAKKDLYDFSEEMVARFFQTLSEACKAVDPHHLNLGIRYQGVPPEWTVKGMQSFDVFSMNCYQPRVPLDVCKKICEKLQMPVMIGEYHFGALDVGLPSPGLVHVRTQKDRGKAYRLYLEDAAANPYCVGVHYFTLYDQSALGRSDGENYNIGFLDICNRIYEPLVRAARAAHEAMYSVAAGTIKPFGDAPEYLPRLF